VGYAQLRRGPAVYWTFYLESGVSRYLPLLGRFNRIDFREMQNFKLAPRLGLITLREEPVSMTAYRIEGFEESPVLSDPDFAERLRERSEPAQRRVGLQMRLFLGDRDQANVNSALDQITRGETLPPAEFARRASEWLKRNHPYSLTPNIPAGDGDQLVKWMISREAGHCELFAGSFVILARSAGFPARLVTGFRGGSWNGYSNNFTIRNSDAHAWAEIFDENLRTGDREGPGAWLRADPLAVAAGPQGEVRGEAALVSRLDRSWKARLDSLRVFWYRRIVSFDQRSQAETLKAVKEATQNSGRWLREAVAEFGTMVRTWVMAPWHFMRFFRVGVSIVLTMAMIWWWRAHGRAWTFRIFRWRRGRGEHPIRREAGYWLARLAALETRSPVTVEAVSALQRLRFGASATWTDPEKIFRFARRALRDARRRERVTRS
jgi:transglutaminase-like putative cysteine protease